RYGYAVGSPLRDLAVGDFNADGYPDVAVVRYDLDTVLILLNAGDGAAPGPDGGGMGPDVVTAARLAEDGSRGRVCFGGTDAPARPSDYHTLPITARGEFGNAAGRGGV